MLKISCESSIYMKSQALFFSEKNIYIKKKHFRMSSAADVIGTSMVNNTNETHHLFIASHLFCLEKLSSWR